MRFFAQNNFRLYKILFQAGNFIVTLLWWNIFIELFIWLQFNAKEGLNLSEGSTEVVLALHNSLSTTVLIVSGFVILLWLVDHFIIDRLRVRFSLFKVTLFQLISFLVVFAAIAFLFGLYHCSVLKGLESDKIFLCVDSFVINHTMLLFLIAGLVIKFSLEFIFEVQRFFGFRMFWKFVLGHYRKPKEENRIFLFVDLVSSTETSVQLGHAKYSEYLQECFSVLGNSLVKTRGSVYQYIGDEVVVTWDGNNPRNFIKAVEFLFLFNKDIQWKKKHFLNKFGLVPEFTASLNSGKIMTAQVGVTKKEIAYHGSVLNTAARLQKKCKAYESHLLATEKFINKLDGLSSSYKYDYLDEVQFEGKQQKERIFKIEKGGREKTALSS